MEVTEFGRGRSLGSAIKFGTQRCACTGQPSRCCRLSWQATRRGAGAVEGVQTGTTTVEQEQLPPKGARFTHGRESQSGGGGGTHRFSFSVDTEVPREEPRFCGLRQ